MVEATESKFFREQRAKSLNNIANGQSQWKPDLSEHGKIFNTI